MKRKKVGRGGQGARSFFAGGEGAAGGKIKATVL